MIAAVQASSREIVAVQITFLHSSAAGKLMLSIRAARSARLATGCCGWCLHVLAWDAQKGLRKHGPLNFSSGSPFWAALGVERYSLVAWPSDTRRLTIYADNDPPGLSGARQYRDDHPEIETRLRYSAHPGEDVDRLYRAVAGDRDAALQRLLEE
jgi:hypothetical protein